VAELRPCRIQASDQPNLFAAANTFQVDPDALRRDIDKLIDPSL